MNALIVDDSAVMRRILLGLLARLELTDVDQAADGVEAVEAVKQKDYGLVLMDWNMPNMLGIDAVRAIRELGKTMPIVMVTTEAEKGRVLDAVEAGATNYIIKPFDSTAAVSKIREILAKAHGAPAESNASATG